MTMLSLLCLAALILGFLLPEPTYEYRFSARAYVDDLSVHFYWVTNHDPIVGPSVHPRPDEISLDVGRAPEWQGKGQQRNSISFLGFGFSTGPVIEQTTDFYISNRDVHCLAIAIWWIAPLLMVPNLMFFVLARRDHHRMQQNLCVVCGYNLVATPFRCPECGTTPTQIRGSQ